MKYYTIVALKRKIMNKFYTANVDVKEVERFIENARSSNCEAIADDMQKRLDGYKAWQENSAQKTGFSQADKQIIENKGIPQDLSPKK